MFWFFIGFSLYFLILLSEAALVRLSSHDLDALKIKKEKAAERAVAQAEQLRSSLAALLLARLLTALSLGVWSIDRLLHHAGLRSALYDISVSSGMSPGIVWTLAGFIIALALALLLWGMQKLEWFKKSSAAAIFLAQRLSLFTAFWKTVFKPFVRIEKKIAAQPADGRPVEPGRGSAAASEKRELELLKSIVQFGDVTVKQVMQPRSKVIAVDFRSTFPELLNTVCENEFSRMPIIDEDLDNVTGILYVKDLVPYLDKPDDFEWQTLIRTNLMLVPESKRGSELLEEFKNEKMHMAVVVDEYGGSAGIVTLEDILEEVIGPIHDEFDEESEIPYRKLDDFNYLFEGHTLLNDVCRITGLPANTFDTARGNSDTLAGLALELRGDIPPVGEEIVWGQYQITVVAADNRRIEQLKLTLPR